MVGSFTALHKGHLSLLSRLSASGRPVTVLVLEEEGDPVPAAARVEWILTLGLDRVGAEAVRRVDLPARVAALGAAVVSASAEDESICREAGARFVLVERDRAAAPATSAEVRAEPARHWEQLLPSPRAHFALSVCLIGPEGTGKSTLAARLAERYRTRWVPEALRSVMVNAGLALGAEHLESAAHRTLFEARSASASGGRVVFLDTDLLSLCLWSDRVLGSRPASLDQLVGQLPIDLYLLTELVDLDGLPRVPGPGRDVFFLRCQGALAGLPHAVLSGSLDERFAQAQEAVEPLLARPLW